MAKLNDIVKFLNSELRIAKIKDDSKNGLQVRCRPEVKRIGFAVDGCLTTFEKAKKLGCDMVIVHHGIRWKYSKRFGERTNINRKREQFLRKSGISLYGAHLPLDENTKYGNNIGLANILKLDNIKKFGRYHGFMVGYKGQFSNPKSLQSIAGILNRELNTRCKVISSGKKMVKSIGIVSGGGSCAFPEALKEVDCLVLGETRQDIAVSVKDNRFNLIEAGHYATETVGVKALMQPLREKFNIQTVFIEDPTGF